MNSKGSSLVLMLVILGVITTSGLMVLTYSNNLSKSENQKTLKSVAENITTTIATALANPNVCLSGFDGAGPEAGMQFLNGGGNVVPFNSTQAGTAQGQDISVAGIYPGAGGARIRFTAGTQILNSNLTLTRLYVANAQQDLVNLSIYHTSVFATFSSPSVPAMSPFPVIDLKLQISGANLIDCQIDNGAGNSNQALCQGMGCNYSVSPSGTGNCTCPLAAMNCSAGNYVTGFSGSTPQCSTTPLQKTCAGTANSYLVGFDNTGSPICAQIALAAPVCPPGTSTGGLGAVANPATCKCNNAGDTWNGSSCVGSILMGCGCSSCPMGVEEFKGAGTFGPPTFTNYYYRFCKIPPGQKAITSGVNPAATPPDPSTSPLGVSSNFVPNGGFGIVMGAYCEFKCDEGANPGTQCSAQSSGPTPTPLCWYIK